MADIKKYDRCPNCGAEADDNTQYCPFCGTLLTIETIEEPKTFSAEFEFTADDNNTGSYYSEPQTDDAPDSFTQRAASEVTDIRKVDIVAKSPSELKTDKASAIVRLIVWILVGAVIINVIGTNSVVRGFALVLFICGIINRIRKVKNESSSPFERFGCDYEAVVLDHSTSTDTILNGESRVVTTVGKVKVLANVMGSEKCILIPAGDGHVSSIYPVGCTVTVRGYEDYWAIKS